MKSLNSTDLSRSVINGLLSLETAVKLIEGGSPLAVAGPEEVLDKLPSGNWIGGTTPYFMTDGGGTIVRDDHVFVTDLSAIGTGEARNYGAEELANISADAPDHGFAIAIIPAMCEAHERFALEAPFYPSTFLKPTVGWIAGCDLDNPTQPKVYDGRGPHKFADRAAVMHVAWEHDGLAQLDIVNPFEPGVDAELRFDEPGFRHTHCVVDGAPTPLADYLRDHDLTDGHRPLLGDYAGAQINVSIKHVDDATGEVTFFAPVFPGVAYRAAAAVPDYAAAFRAALEAKPTEQVFWSCNCILNFRFGELEGKAIGGVAGPITFGEIAYQLLNQTMVTVRII